ncbi:MAG TPA: hypothetical protein VMW20_07660 [Candidatus Nanoarchaeia archaeon]|nr:hypothetical protein [Candidatus Nanoarchaeia archaeon]
MDLKNIVNNKEHMKKIGLITLVIFIFFIGFGYLLFNSSQMQEYNNYLEIRNQDIEIMNSNYDEWNDIFTEVTGDEKITQDEFGELNKIALQYEVNSSKAELNSNKFRNFIENNTIILKISGIDTSDNLETLSNDIMTFEGNKGNIRFVLIKANSMREQAA